MKGRRARAGGAAGRFFCCSRRWLANSLLPRALLWRSCGSRSFAGVLSIALTNEEYADEAVRTPLVPAACRYLRRAVAAMGSTPSGGDGGGPAAEAEGEEVSRLRHQRLLAALRCLMCTGEYVESLGPFLQFCGVDTVCALLRHIRAAAAVGGAGASGPAAQRHGWLMHEALQVVCSLLAHRKFAELLVEAGGVQLLLALPRCGARHAARRRGFAAARAAVGRPPGSGCLLPSARLHSGDSPQPLLPLTPVC